ncbi:MAG: HNH endonuclease [Flavobacterium sp.]
MFKVTAEPDKILNNYTINFNGKFKSRYIQPFKTFTELYEADIVKFHPNKKPPLKLKSNRICRYCKNPHPIVNFRKTAHLIPQLMGNKNLITDIECDNCNFLFSKYENDLANFIGVYRSLTNIKGQNGIPTFKTPDKLLKVESDSNQSKINIITGNDSYFEIDEQSKKMYIHSVKHSYIPINVYKILLKIGYALIPEEELPLLETTRKILMTNEHNESLIKNSFFRIFGAFCPGPPFNSPMLILFKKKIATSKKPIPTRSLLIYFQNYIYQIFIPFHEDDRWMYGSEIEFNLFPPLIDSDWIDKFGDPSHFNIDMSHGNLIKNEKHTVSLTYDSIQKH